MYIASPCWWTAGEHLREVNNPDPCAVVPHLLWELCSETPSDKQNPWNSDHFIFYNLVARLYVILFSASCREPHSVDAAGPQKSVRVDRWKHTAPGVNLPSMITHPVKYITLYKTKLKKLARPQTLNRDIPRDHCIPSRHLFCSQAALVVGVGIRGRFLPTDQFQTTNVNIKQFFHSPVQRCSVMHCVTCVAVVWLALQDLAQ